MPDTTEMTPISRPGELLLAGYQVASDLAKGEVLTLTDPRDQTEMPAVLANGAIAPIPASAFADYRAKPIARSGTATLTQLDSFIALTNRFKADNSAVFANDGEAAPRLTTVFDYNPEGPSEARFGRHRATYAFPLSKEWQAWTKADAKSMGMADFARFIEDHIVDVSADPVEAFAESSKAFVAANRGTIATPSKLVEISRGLQIYEKAVIKEARNLASGEAQFTFDSEHTDGDGKPLVLPTMFSITIPVFARSADLFRLIARFRYRKTGDGLVFWYELWRPDLTFETAFNEALDTVAKETGLPIFVGAPEA